jgi:hypothetical protein
VDVYLTTPFETLLGKAAALLDGRFKGGANGGAPFGFVVLQDRN